MKKCVEIVVTYNRKKLLEENINALLNQTYKNHDIMIIDNASTDGTKELIDSYNDKRIKYYNTGTNLGGAGGFAFGMREVLNLGNIYDYAWIMDDDSIPNNNALESLINKSELIGDKFSFLASLVYWTDDKLFEMNVPNLSNLSKMDIDLNLISEFKLMKIDSCSFVGCFVNLKYAQKTGLPISDFFIYGDDVEYTTRLRKFEQAYLDLDSKIIHKAPSNKGADIVTASEDRINRFYYQSRNGMYIARKNHKVLRRFKTVLKRLIKIILKSPNYKLKRIHFLIKGTFAGFFFNPKIEYVNIIEK